MKITMDCYEINRCGYYPRKTEIPLFGDIQEVMTDIHAWLDNAAPTIEETKTFNQLEDSDQLPVYCYEIQNNKNEEFLFTIWNESETLNGNFASVQKGGALGTAKVDQFPVPATSIPGFPTYFWIIPSLGKIFCIRYESRVTGIKGFSRYIKGYLEMFSKWTVGAIEDRSLDTHILGFSSSGESQNLERVYPDFKTGLARVPGEIDYIRREFSKIQKILRKDEFITTREISNTDLMASLMSKVGLSRPAVQSSSARFKYEFDFVPGQEDIDEIIDYWESEEHHSKWDDIGFKFKGGKIKWLGEAVLRRDIEVNLTLKDNNMINTEVLIGELSRIKPGILRAFGIQQ